MGYGISIASTSIGIVGMLANIFFLSILLKDKKKKTIFITTIFSLGIADFLVSLVLSYSGLYFILQELSIFPESEEFLAVFRANLVFCQTSSTLHVLFISAERLFVVFYPLRFHLVFTKKICIAVLIIIWVASLPTSLLKASELRYFFKPATIFVGVFLLCSYSAICIRLMRRQQRNSSIARRSSRRNDSAFRRSLAHSAIVTIAFFMCTIPYLATKDLNSPRGVVARILLVGNVVINPFVYFLFAYCKETIRNKSLASTSINQSDQRADPTCKAVRRSVYITESKCEEKPAIECDPMKVVSSQS